MELTWQKLCASLLSLAFDNFHVLRGGFTVKLVKLNTQGSYLIQLLLGLIEGSRHVFTFICKKYFNYNPLTNWYLSTLTPSLTFHLLLCEVGEVACILGSEKGNIELRWYVNGFGRIYSHVFLFFPSIFIATHIYKWLSGVWLPTVPIHWMSWYKDEGTGVLSWYDCVPWHSASELCGWRGKKGLKCSVPKVAYKKLF